jgi:GT2 family glycosyltransferase
MALGMISDTPVKSEADQAAFFKAGMAATLQAETICGVRDFDIAIAGFGVRLRFAGAALADLFIPALAHLPSPAGPLVAVFHIWDSASSGVAMTRPPVGKECLTDRGDIWGLMSQRYRSAFHWSEWSVNLLDSQTGEAVFWVRDAARLPYWSRSSPLRTLFHWLLEGRGCQLLHAACIGTDDGGVLITGRGGLGKSSTALAGLRAGLRYVGDDYVVVQTAPAPVAWSLYATAKLHHDQLALMPELAELAVNGQSDEKAVLDLYPSYAGQIALSLPVRAVLTPRITNQAGTDFAPVSRAALRQAASFTTMTQLPHAGRRSYEMIGQIVAAVPGLCIQLGHDRAAIPAAIRGLLAGAGDMIARHIQPDLVFQPLVSVVIPVRNGADFIAEAVGSILAQDYPNIEIIIIDDGSTDDIAGAVAKLGLDVRLFHHRDLGPAEARNIGIRNASAEYIAFLDADDLWPAGRLAAMVEHLNAHPGTQLVHGHGQLMQKNAEGIYEYAGSPHEAFGFYIGAGLYRRAAFETVGMFDPALRFGEDVDWFARAGRMALAIDRLDQVSLLVRRHERNMTRGKSLAELRPLLLVKKMLDWQRAAAADKMAAAP